jgi:hypothetical protein
MGPTLATIDSSLLSTSVEFGSRTVEPVPGLSPQPAIDTISINIVSIAVGVWDILVVNKSGIMHSLE